MTNFMRLAAFLTAIAAGTAAVSCSYDDTQIWNELKRQEQRIASLETLCSQLNTNISSLRSLLEAQASGDMVTSVAPITEDGRTVGYTISFEKGGPITIYNGKDGSDGKDGDDGRDGTDGHAPVIGISLDNDGFWYWTLDGNWMLDNNGNKVRANGKDGTDGQDGTTPLLKIEDDYWFISYDNGSSWSRLGKASGEDGASGDSMFSSIEDGESSVTFILSSGQSITIPKYSRKEPIAISFSRDSISIGPNETAVLEYSLTNATETTVIKAIAEYGWKVEVSKSEKDNGTISVTSPTDVYDCEVLVFVYDGDGSTVMASIQFLKKADSAGSWSISKDGKTLTINVGDTSFIMNKVAACSFRMGDGTQYENQGMGYGYTNPIHEVTLTKDYWIGEKAVDERLFGKFTQVDQNLVEYPGNQYSSCSKNFVGIENAVKVLEGISKEIGLPFRLPTEAEAENAFCKGLSSGGTQCSDWMTYNKGWYYWGFDISQDVIDPEGPADSTPTSWPVVEGSSYETLAEVGFSEWYKVRKGSGKPAYRYTTRSYPVILVLSNNDLESLM